MGDMIEISSAPPAPNELQSAASLPLRAVSLGVDLAQQFPWLRREPSSITNEPSFAHADGSNYVVEAGFVVNLTRRQLQAAEFALHYPEPNEPVIIPVEDE